MADDGIARQAERMRKGGHIRRLRVQPVVQRIAGLGQAASANIQDVGVEVLAELLADKAPGDRRAGDAGHDYHGVALRARAGAAAVAQVMLADAVGEHIAAVEKLAHCWTPFAEGMINKHPTAARPRRARPAPGRAA